MNDPAEMADASDSVDFDIPVLTELEPDKSWLPDFFNTTDHTTEFISGFVTNETDLERLLECHRRHTLSTLVYL